MSHPFVRTERPGRWITSIVMDRPEAKNALTLAMYDSMTQALEQAREDPEVRVVLIRSAHAFFTSGNDLQDFMNTPPAGEDSPVFRFLQALIHFPKPLIAQVDGWAVGIGTTMLLHCDLVYASERARFKMPFVNLALVPEAGSSLILPRMLGHQRAAELLMLGRDFGATRAHEVGIVNDVVPHDELAAHTLAQATALGKLAPEAVQLTKMLMKKTQHAGLEGAMREESELFVQRLHSAELAEAVAAFFEKREPHF